MNQHLAAVPAPIGANSTRETSDDYARVLCRDGNYRISLCRQGIQWLLQRRRENAAAAQAWDSVGYCTTCEGLKRLVRPVSGLLCDFVNGLPVHLRGEIPK
ncbi:hypothetical protein [Rhodobacter sp. CZR27]|uniref:hypothetical protein n=1 Tax=Rhodobacter sp. CZR27 TaxID=2033869 RepID=UPI0012FD1347|nr:hypothetical protein [Rhodobacter sp. CZR27]